MPTLAVALTLIVMEQALLDQTAIAVSIGGVCANSEGSFDCECYRSGLG